MVWRRRVRGTRKVFLVLASLLLVSFLASLPQAQASQILSYQVSASTDDATKYTTNQFSTTINLVAVGSSSPQYQDNGLRFLNVSVDSTYSLYYAKLKFKAGATSSGTVTSKIKGEDNVAPATFSTLSDFNARPRTNPAFDVSWTPTSWTGGNWYEIDITTLVNYMLSNASWVSGNNMSLFWTWNSGTALRRAISYNGGASNAPILEIKYKETFYLTFYYGDYGYPDVNTVDYFVNIPDHPISINGSIYPILEASYIELWTSMNSSFIFLNYTFINDTTYYANFLPWQMPENYGNHTIYAYSTTTPTPTVTTDRFIIGLTIGAGAISIFAFIILISSQTNDEEESYTED